MLNVRAIKELVRQYNLGISPRRLGQHFLVDPKALARIAQTLGATPSDRILEIGAGLGALTDELVQIGATLHAVERDPRFVRVLTDRFRNAENLQIVQSDILQMDLASTASGQPKSLLVIGNIPFSMTSPILEFLLHERQWVKRAVLTVQKEVALRIVAQPSTKAYSSITLLVQVAFKPRVAFSISPGAFYPQPKVTSSILCLDPLSEPSVPPEEEEAVLKLVRSLFTHRRKTLLNSLCAGGIGLERQEILTRLKKASIDPIRRPETFTLKEMVTLHRCLHDT